jgi:glycosyltransferase involved in cell wall biosynthesis
VPELLAAFALLRERLPDARLLLVGGVSARYSLPALPPGVEHVDYVGEDRLWALMRAADVHVSLRYPTMGETSGSAVRSLSLGKPLVVSDVGWFSELPEDVALKVPLDGREVDVLAGALELAAEHAATMGAAARAYALRELDVDRVAALYAAALAEAAGGDAVEDAVLREVADAAAFVGIAPDDPLAAEVARRIAP